MNQIDQHAVSLDENYDEGIKQLASLAADKKVVGVGESTHGTHEFFQFKADLVCELIINHEFRTFALEDEGQKCQAINEFIQTGEGSVDELIEPLYAVWQTREIRDLIIRLRDLASCYDIFFIGVDVEDSALTEKPGKPMYEQRDKLMADNVVEATTRGKTFVWAHNSHISKMHLDVRNMGRNLAETLDEEYTAIGQFFGQGMFNSKILPEDKEVAVEDFKHIPLSPVEAPAPQAGFLEEVLDQAECRSYFIDLSSEDRIGTLDGEHKCRAFGAVTRTEDIDKYPMSVRPYDYYDVLVYFKNTRHAETIDRKDAVAEPGL